MAVFSASTFLQSIPLGTRILTALLLSFTFFLAFLRLTRTETGLHYISFSKQDSALEFPWLVLVPGASFWYPWTLITSSFCETSFFEFLISAASLPLAGRYLERQWGAVELLRFSAIVLVASNLIAWGLALILFGVLRMEVLIYGTQYHGLEALQVAFLVAFTQAIPEHQVQLFKGKLKLRVKDLPMLYVTFSNVACIIGYTSPFILIQFGWLVSWAYLRFFQVSEHGYRGDRSEAFAFVNWFPPLAHKPVTFISNALYGLFVKLKVVQPWSGGDYADIETGQANVASAAPSRAEAERRRAMALKALDQRIGAKSNLQRSDSSSSRAESSAQPPVPTVVFQAPAEEDPEGDIGAQLSKPEK